MTSEFLTSSDTTVERIYYGNGAELAWWLGIGGGFKILQKELASAPGATCREHEHPGGEFQSPRPCWCRTYNSRQQQHQLWWPSFFPCC